MPNNSRIGSSLPSNLTTKFPLPGFSLLITTSTAAPCCARYFCIFPARVLNTDHCLHASMDRTLPPAAAATSADAAFLDAAAGFFFAAVGFFAFVASAFVALALDVAPLVFAIVSLESSTFVVVVDTIVKGTQFSDLVTASSYLFPVVFGWRERQ